MAELKRLPIYLLLDVSGSMSGDPINAVNKGMEVLVSSLKAEPKACKSACISVITYNNYAMQLVSLTELDKFRVPSLSTGGGTNLSAALQMASEKMRSELTSNDYYPLVFIMTDGDVGNVTEALQTFNGNKMGVVVACAAGSGANAEALKQVTPYVIRLDTADQATISSFFKWISDSIGSGKMNVEKEGAAVAGLKATSTDIHVDNLPEANVVPVYDEPEGIDYIIIKVKGSVINGERGGSLYETTRKAWHAKLESAMPYKYVLSVVGGIVQEVYHVSRWFTSPTEAPRIEFEGEVAEFKIRNLFVGKMIPECYRVKGLASPFLYKKKTGEPTVEPAAPIEKNEIEKPAITPKTESESKIKVHGKSKGWTALGIIDAYTKIHPSATVEDINKAFPRELFASTKTYKNIVIDRKVYWQEAVDAGKEQDYEWLKKSREDGAYYFTLEDGTEVTFYKIVWSEDIFPKIVEHAKTLGIEVASFEDIGRGKGRGDYEIEYLPNFSFHVDGRMTVSTLQRQFRDAFNAGLRVYEPSGKKAHSKAVLAKLRTINDATEVGEFEASNDMKVMEFEYKMKSIFGINVQVALLDDSKLSRDDSPLKDAGKI